MGVIEEAADTELVTEEIVLDDVIFLNEVNTEWFQFEEDVQPAGALMTLSREVEMHIGDFDPETEDPPDPTYSQSGDTEASIDIIIADFEDEKSILKNEVLNSFGFRPVLISVVVPPEFEQPVINYKLQSDFEIVIKKAIKSFPEDVTDIDSIDTEIVDTYKSGSKGGDNRTGTRREESIALTNGRKSYIDPDYNPETDPKPETETGNYGLIYSFKWTTVITPGLVAPILIPNITITRAIESTMYFEPLNSRLIIRGTHIPPEPEEEEEEEEEEE